MRQNKTIHPRNQHHDDSKSLHLQKPTTSPTTKTTRAKSYATTTRKIKTTTTQKSTVIKEKNKKAAYSQPSRSFNGEIHHLDQHQAYFITQKQLKVHRTYNHKKRPISADRPPQKAEPTTTTKSAATKPYMSLRPQNPTTTTTTKPQATKTKTHGNHGKPITTTTTKLHNHKNDNHDDQENP